MLLGRIVWSWNAYRDDPLLVVFVELEVVVEVEDVEVVVFVKFGNFSIFVKISSLEPGVRGSSTVQLL